MSSLHPLDFSRGIKCALSVTKLHLKEKELASPNVITRQLQAINRFAMSSFSFSKTKEIVATEFPLSK